MPPGRPERSRAFRLSYAPGAIVIALLTAGDLAAASGADPPLAARMRRAPHFRDGDWAPVANYSARWYLRGHFRASEFASARACAPCAFAVRGARANSSPRDLLATGMFRRSAGVIPCVRTLRTAGSRCTVVVFTDAAVFSAIGFHRYLADCGVTLVNVGALFSERRNFLFMLRNSACYDWLRYRDFLFDRVILIDLFDTVFQGDPFTDEIADDVIAFSVETAQIRGNHLRGAALLVGAADADSRVAWQPVVNCGTVMGSTRTVLSFLALEFRLIRRLPWADYVALIETNYPDQALVNVLVRLGMLAEHGMTVRLYGVEELYVTTYKVYKRPYTFRIGEYAPSGVYPVLVHNYDRVKEFCRSITAACPPEFDTPDQYVRC
jgi:hypothetical protein